MKWIAMVILASVCCTAQHTFPATDSNNAFTGTNSFQGVTVASLNTIDQQAGGDCGAKINAADSILGSRAGEIWLNQNCGTNWTRAVRLSAGHTLRCIQGGTYQTSAGVTLAGSNSGIIGPPTAANLLAATEPCTIQAANSALLPEVVHMTGSETFLRDITINGNKTNTGATLGVLGSGNRLDFQSVVVQNAVSHGISITTNGADLFAKVASFNNGGDGFLCTGIADLRMVQNQMQSNGANGIELNNCSSVSYSEGDIGGNQGDGLLAYGVAASGSNTGILIGNNIGQNQKNDVELIGTDGLGGCLGAYGWTIQGNNITGSGSKAKNNTYDNIKLTNDCYENVAGNNLGSPGTAGNYYKAANEVAETNSSIAHDNHIGDNSIHGTYATAPEIVSTFNPSYTVFPTGDDFSFYDNLGSVTPILQLSSNTNTLRLFGHPTQQEIQIQPDPLTTTVDLKAADTIFNVGIGNNGTGFKHKRGIAGCATSASAGAFCTTTFSWATPFADANYTVSCSGDGVTRVFQSTAE
jgi:hypothetical protein